MTYDNLTTAVEKVLTGKERQEQTSFLSFRGKYLFESHFCTPGAGHEKGGVEPGVGYVRRQYLVPLPQVESYEALNGYLLSCCLGDDERTVKGQSASMGEMWQKEQPHLRALPQDAYDCCRQLEVTLTPYSQVIIETNRYSVPVEQARQQLAAKVYPFHIEIYRSDQTTPLAVHERCYGREQDLFEPLHYLPLLAQRPGAFDYAKPMKAWRATWPAVYETLLLETQLKQLGLTTFLRNHAAFATAAAQNQHSYSRYLLTLSEQEVAQRETSSRQRRLKEAKFPLMKTLAEFDFAAIPNLNQQKILHLAQGDYIRKAEPVILLGNPGLGKTHLATALAVEACRQQVCVRFYNSAALVNELLAAQQEQRLANFLDSAQRHPLIVLDELGFIPFNPAAAHLFFQFCSALYERVALIITTNLRFADWTQVFGDVKLTLALLDRLTHKAHFIEFTADSYRFRQQRLRVAELTLAANSVEPSSRQNKDGFPA